MLNHRQTILASRPAAMVLALSLVTGLSVPFVMLPSVNAAPVVPSGATELSPAPVEQTQAVPPNIVVTFDDSGSMANDYMGDKRPFDNGSWSGPWRCAGVIDPAAASGLGARAMNGVYYNPNVPYAPPVYANGNNFPVADASLKAVWDDGIKVNRPLGGSSGVTDFTGKVVQRTGWYWNGSGGNNGYKDPDNWVWGQYPTGSGWYSNNSHYNNGNPNPPDTSGERKNGTYPFDDNRWKCPADGTSPIAGGGPYYYEYTGPAISVDQFGNPTSTSDLYNKSNWTAVAVPADQYQNWANWWAYYRTRTLMARTSVSRAFGSKSLSAKDPDGGFGSDIRVAWQELNDGDFKLPGSAIISAITDTANCTDSKTDPKTTQRSGATTTPPDCYRSAFFNWIFSVGASGNTPARAAAIRAGEFFKRGNGNTGATGNLEDPYWQPPQTGTFNAGSNPGNELYCRQNFHMLVTDGYWNEAYTYSTTGYALPDADVTLPDGVNYSATADVSKIYADVQAASQYVPSQAQIAFNYWATNLRPDLFDPANGKYVPPYLPDSSTGLFPTAGTVQFVTGKDSNGNDKYTTLPAEQYFNPNNDPATWPHMVEYMVTLGVPGELIHSDDYDCKNAPNDACSLRTGVNTSRGSVGWPKPYNNNPTGIDDTWNAAVNSRGRYFNAGNPQNLVDQLSSILSNIAARSATPKPGAVNASVATVGALSFNTGHNADWSGVFQAMVVDRNGTVSSTPLWDAGAELDSRAATDRDIYTGAYVSGAYTSFQFTAANAASLDTLEQAGLKAPPLAGGNDTLANRIAYITGDRSHEGDGTYRTRNHLLGAIIRSQPVYVSYPSSNYYNRWPNNANGTPAAETAKSYDTFVAKYAKRPGTVYVGANDGMLHAFNAPVPTCTAFDPNTGDCTTYDKGSNPGKEQWAFIPRAVYANLGNLTNVSDFQFRPTVDGSPVTRDVFFGGDWHTMLAGGVGVGGRGVYALDITGDATDPTQTVTAPTKVLWEFDSDMAVDSGCVAISGSSPDTQGGGCRASDLGFTVSQPNIGRLHNGKWAVLVPNGYFPDCSKGDTPTGDSGDVSKCATIAAQAPQYSNKAPYSALFVLDAETGKVIAELKTPDLSSQGVYSFGLATPVLGDYDNDQVDDVAFAGDAEGNLWRFNLKDADPSNWTVTLAYQAPTQGLQPITSMPRLFPDPTTNRFMVVFGTGKYLGADDNLNVAVQAVYGIRDPGDTGSTVEQGDLVQQFLHEAQAPATLPDGTPNPIAGATLRCITGSAGDACGSGATSVNAVPASAGGWYFELKTMSGSVQTDQGERVVVTPGAIFPSNTVIISTLMTGASGTDPCNPSTQGAIMAINVTDGGPGTGVSSLGGYPYVGARVNNARTSGSLPVLSALGGGQVYIPGVTLSGTNSPISLDAPIWRRRSWQEINENQ